MAKKIVCLSVCPIARPHNIESTIVHLLLKNGFLDIHGAQIHVLVSRSVCYKRVQSRFIMKNPSHANVAVW